MINLDGLIPLGFLAVIAFVLLNNPAPPPPPRESDTYPLREN